MWATHATVTLSERLERQLTAIEAGVDPVLVGQRIRDLKAELERTQTALSNLDHQGRARGAIDVAEACDLLAAVPDLSRQLAAADPQLRREIYNAFRLSEIDGNAGQIRLRALVSSALSEASDLDDLAVARKATAGAGFEPATFGL